MKKIVAKFRKIFCDRDNFTAIFKTIINFNIFK